MGSDEETSDLFRAQMRELGVQMLGCGSYEEPLLSWYDMHDLSCYLHYIT